MSEPSSGQISSSHFLKLVLGVVSLIALAMLACSGSGDGSVSTPTAPPGMFSTLPTTESPVLGDQPPTVELNTPEPTYTPNPTYTPVPAPTPLPTGTPTPNPTGTPTPTGHAQSYLHARTNAHAQSDRHTSADGHSCTDGPGQADGYGQA